MTTLITAFSFLSPILIGFLVLEFCFPQSKRRWLWITWKIFLAPITGFAIISLIYYLWSILFSPDSWIPFLVILESLVVVLFLILVLRRKQPPIAGEDMIPARSNRYKILSIAATAVFTFLLVNYLDEWLRASLSTPYGDWDAWAIWNLRASFLASGEYWLSGFSDGIAWSHPDYPLLLPLNITRMWMLLGDRTVWVPILINLIFQVSLVGMLITTILMLRDYLQAILAGLVSLLVLFTSLSFKLYADIPLAAFILGGNILIFLSEVDPKSNKYNALLSGVLVGAAVWTKNEGWAFLTSVMITRIIFDLFIRRSRSISKSWWGWFTLGVMPFLIATIHLKLVIAPPGDLVGNLTLSDLLTDIISIERYLTILRSGWNHLVSYGSLVLPLVLLLLIYGVIMGLSIPRQQAGATLALALRISLLAISYFLVYLVTPKDLVWHLNTSMERLITQIFPSFTFLLFLSISGPIGDTIAQTRI